MRGYKQAVIGMRMKCRQNIILLHDGVVDLFKNNRLSLVSCGLDLHSESCGDWDLPIVIICTSVPKLYLNFFM